MSDGDDALIVRLRDLALVELDALRAGLAAEAAEALLAAHGEELDDALAAARTQAGELCRTIAAGDPLVALDASAAVRARDGGRDEAERVGRRLAARAAAARRLARLDDAVAALYPRLVELDRQRASRGD